MRDDEKLKQTLTDLKARFDAMPEIPAAPILPEPAAPEPDVSVATMQDCIWIKAPYHERFKAELKQLGWPPKYPGARWDATRKAWWVDISHAPAALSIIEKHFGVKLKLNPFG
jgi:hypothetical protein